MGKHNRIPFSELGHAPLHFPFSGSDSRITVLSSREWLEEYGRQYREDSIRLDWLGDRADQMDYESHDDRILYPVRNPFRSVGCQCDRSTVNGKHEHAIGCQHRA